MPRDYPETLTSAGPVFGGRSGRSGAKDLHVRFWQEVHSIELPLVFLKSECGFAGEIGAEQTGHQEPFDVFDNASVPSKWLSPGGRSGLYMVSVMSRPMRRSCEFHHLSDTERPAQHAHVQVNSAEYHVFNLVMDE